jgi:hypothetical protein
MQNPLLRGSIRNTASHHSLNHSHSGGLPALGSTPRNGFAFGPPRGPRDTSFQFLAIPRRRLVPPRLDA